MRKIHTNDILLCRFFDVGDIHLDPVIIFFLFPLCLHYIIPQFVLGKRCFFGYVSQDGEGDLWKGQREDKKKTKQNSAFARHFLSISSAFPLHSFVVIFLIFFQHCKQY